MMAGVMRRDALVFAISGTFFGVIVGWILGSQGPGGRTPVAVAPTAAATQTAQAPALDLQRIADLEQRADANPTDAAVRAELGNVYFDAERFDLAIPWYEASMALSGNDVNVSTDLAVSYFYAGQTDMALAQLERSLAIEPDHVKTIFNQGIILATGKSDLTAAARSFERVVALSPGSEEGRRAQEMLDGIAQHPAGGGSPGG